MNGFKIIGLYFIFAIIITVSWQGYEYLTFGEVRPDNFHTLIAVLFSWSLVFNVILYKETKSK